MAMTLKLLLGLTFLAMVATDTVSLLEATKRFCRKKVPRFEAACLNEGYRTQILQNCTSTGKEMTGNKVQRCAEVERMVVNRCDYKCQSNDTKVRFHIRGPRPRYAVIGQGSSITCSVAAPQNDSTFEMYIDGTPASKLSPYSPWYNASFTRSTYRYRNGTVSTAIEGFVDKFTSAHNGALINCTSWKYNGHIATYIRLRPDNSTDNNTEWTPIFNSTSATVGPFSYPNLPELRVKFTKHKEVDKYLYQSVNVNLYNGNGTRLGNTNFILYGRKVEADEDYPSNTSITGYKRFYFDGPWSGSSSCSEYLSLDYLEGFNFEMQTSVGSSNMFQFTKPDGEVHSESMDHCSSFSTWQEMVQEAQSADLKLTTWTQDLADYFTTEYSVVEF